MKDINTRDMPDVSGGVTPSDPCEPVWPTGPTYPDYPGPTEPFEPWTDPAQRQA
jgi:hypothetical protein